MGFIIIDINIPNAFGKNKYVRNKLSFDLYFYISEKVIFLIAIKKEKFWFSSVFGTTFKNENIRFPQNE